AISHALGADDPDLAARLLEQDRPTMDKSYRTRTWLARVKALPTDVVRTRPMLTMWFAWGLLNSGEIEAAESRLEEVQRWVDAVDDPDCDEARTLARELAASRVYLAQTEGAAGGT